MVEDFVKFSKSLQVPSSIYSGPFRDQPISGLVPMVVEQTTRAGNRVDQPLVALHERVECVQLTVEGGGYQVVIGPVQSK